jgi:hypothetical protein
VAYIEIAAALLASGQAPVDDVLAFLREARRRSAGSGFTGLCAALTSVAWLTEGREAEAQGALADVTDPDALQRFEAHDVVWLPDGVWHAVMGVVLERMLPELAAPHFRALAEGPLAASALGKLASRSRARAPSGRAGKRGTK